jgi:ribosomal protein L32
MSAVSNANLNQWVAVAQSLCRNAPHSAACPECGEAKLEMRDREYGPPHSLGRERYLFCKACGAFNVVNLRRAGAADSRFE